jgi:hypothetical protein
VRALRIPGVYHVIGGVLFAAICIAVRFNCDLPVRCLQLLNQAPQNKLSKRPARDRFIILFEVVA